MLEAKVAVIGGSGLYEIEGLGEVKETRVTTPFGKPSDAIILGTLEGVRVAFLPRHGRGHRVSPGELPAKANIYALKSLGVERIISVTAVGSLNEEITPPGLVIPDQLIDQTKGRDSTFFGGGVVVHIAFAEPFCPVLSQVLFKAATEAGAKVHKGGVHLAMEGPQFSTRAESMLYRSWGADIISMTASPEAKLAREAEICYATLAIVTDLDCWHSGYASVTTEMIFSNLLKGVEAAKKVLKLAIPAIPRERDCACATALKDAIATSPEYISPRAKKELKLLIGKYLDE